MDGNSSYVTAYRAESYFRRITLNQSRFHCAQNMVIDSYEGITMGEQAGKENNMKKHYKLEHCITSQT